MVPAYLADLWQSNPVAPCQKNRGPECIKSIIIASKAFCDGFHSALQLEEQQGIGPNLTVYYHKNCVSKYTTKSNVHQHSQPNSQSNVSGNPPMKNSCQSSVLSFQFYSTAFSVVKIVKLRKILNIQTSGEKPIAVILPTPRKVT